MCACASRRDVLSSPLGNSGADRPLGCPFLREASLQKSLLIDPAKCTSCLQCEMACSLEHTGAFNPALSRIKIFEFEHGALAVPYTCTQCAEAWCMQACPVEAITRNMRTGAVEVDEATCIGCKVCTIACPFGTINYTPHNGKVVTLNTSSVIFGSTAFISSSDRRCSGTPLAEAAATILPVM